MVHCLPLVLHCPHSDALVIFLTLYYVYSGIPKEEGSGVACSSSDYTGVSLTTSNTSGAGVKVCAPVAKVPAPVPVPTIPSRQSLPGITSRTGKKTASELVCTEMH